MLIETEGGKIIDYGSDSEFTYLLNSVPNSFKRSWEIESPESSQNENGFSELPIEEDFYSIEIDEIDAEKIAKEIDDYYGDKTDDYKFMDKGTLMYGME